MTISYGIVIFLHDDENMSLHDRESLESDEPTHDAIKYKRLMTSAKTFLIATFVTMSTVILVPSGDKVTIYLVLRGVDRYAAEHPGSVASPETLLRAADNVGTLVAQVSDVASQFLGTAGSGLKVANTALERANKAIGTDAAKQAAKQEAGAGRQ